MQQSTRHISQKKDQRNTSNDISKRISFTYNDPFL